MKTFKFLKTALTLVLLFAFSFSLSFGQVYSTIASGAWDDPSIWLGGNMPDPDHIDNITVILYHDVTLDHKKIKIESGGSLLVDSVSLIVDNKDIEVKEGTLTVNGGLIDVQDGDIKIDGINAAFYAYGSQLTIEKDFKNKDGLRVLKNTCFTVGNKYENEDGVDSLINVCGKILDNNFELKDNAFMYIIDSELSVFEGDLKSDNNSIVEGQLNVLLISDGDLDNNTTANWTAIIDQYFVGDNITGVSAGYLPTSQSTNLSTFFFPCSCEDYDLLTLEMDTTQNVCSSGNPGVLTAVPGAGTPPYQYSWSNGAITPSISSVPAGMYSVTVTDQNGDVAAVSGQIRNLDDMTLQTGVQDVSCFGESDGIILTVPLTNGMPTNGTFSWLYNGHNIPNPGNMTAIFHLTAGLYTEIVLDNATGCLISQDFPIIQPDSLFTSIDKGDLSCPNADDGFIHLGVVGGTAPYSFDWNLLSGNDTIENLTAGIYEVVISDVNGCEIQETIEILDYDLSITFNINDVNCFGGYDGFVIAQGLGGALPYTYEWDRGDESPVITGLEAETYEVTLTDASGCSLIEVVAVNQPDELIIDMLSTTPESCFGLEDGSAIPLVSGGVLPYFFNWENNSHDSIPNNLFQGFNDLLVLDANNCPATSTALVSGPSKIEIGIISTIPCSGNSNGSITPVITGGEGPYSFLWNDASTDSIRLMLPAGLYGLTITDQNGCMEDTIFILDSNSFEIAVSGTDVSCFGGQNGSAQVQPIGGSLPYSFLWSNNAETTSQISNLMAGIHTVIVTDNNGCQSSSSVTLSEGDEITGVLSGTPLSCHGDNNGSVSISVSGGSIPYSYLWSQGNIGETAHNLAAGMVSVTVTDAEGCDIQMDTTISQPDELVVTIDSIRAVSSPGANDGYAIISVVGGTQPYSYHWFHGPDDDTLTGMPEGSYNVTVLDANQCGEMTFVNIPGAGQAKLASPITQPGDDFQLYFDENSGCINIAGLGIANIILILEDGTKESVDVNSLMGQYCSESGLQISSVFIEGTNNENEKWAFTFITPVKITSSSSGIMSNTQELIIENPVSVEIRKDKLFLTTSKSRIIQVDIITLNGQNIGSLYQGRTESGMETELDLNTLELPTGIYLYMIKSEGDIIKADQFKI